MNIKFWKLEELMQIAIRILTDSVIEVTNRNTQKESVITLDWSSIISKTYAINNLTLAFYYNDALYVIPYTQNAENLLKNRGFLKNNMYVPFSDGDYPTKEAEKWEELEKCMSDIYEAEVREECIRWAAKKGYGNLTDTILTNYCIQIPQTGIVYLDYSRKKHLFKPYFDYRCTKPDMDNIGKYRATEECCIFVYSDGCTYITPRVSLIVRFLKINGYQESFDIKVPFTRNTIFMNTNFNLIWKHLLQI